MPCAFSAYYTKYSQKNMAAMLRNIAEILNFQKKFTKTAGFGECQQLDLDFLCQKLYIYQIFK